MNRPIAKILLALIFILFSHFCSKAQDSLVTPRGDTIKVIVVVTPGQRYVKKPVVHVTAPSTAERSGTSYNDIPVSKPVRTSATDDDNTAPSTAERSGYHDYLNDHQKPRTHANASTGVNSASTPAQRITSPATNSTVAGNASTSPVTAPADGTGYHDYLNDNSKSRTNSKTGAGVKGTGTLSTRATTPVTSSTVTDNTSALSNTTTAKTTGYHDYLNDNTKPRTNSNAGTGAISSTSNSSTSSSTTTTTTTTTTILPDGQKKINVKKTDTVYIKKTDTVFVKQDDDKTRGMKIIFAEVGGPGLAISLNYDARFGSERKGWGYRIGAGYFGDTYGNTVFTIPLQANYLLTKDETNFLELGAGTTFINSTGSNKGKTFIFDRVTGFAGTATIGYRYQPADHKLNFRIGFVPIFYDQGIIWAGGISVGYNLK